MGVTGIPADADTQGIGNGTKLFRCAAVAVDGIAFVDKAHIFHAKPKTDLFGMLCKGRKMGHDAVVVGNGIKFGKGNSGGIGMQHRKVHTQ